MAAKLNDIKIPGIISDEVYKIADELNDLSMSISSSISNLTNNSGFCNTIKSTGEITSILDEIINTSLTDEMLNCLQDLNKLMSSLDNTYSENKKAFFKYINVMEFFLGHQ